MVVGYGNSLLTMACNVFRGPQFSMLFGEKFKFWSRMPNGFEENTIKFYCIFVGEKVAGPKDIPV